MENNYNYNENNFSNNMNHNTNGHVDDITRSHMEHTIDKNNMEHTENERDRGGNMENTGNTMNAGGNHMENTGNTMNTGSENMENMGNTMNGNMVQVDSSQEVPTNTGASGSIYSYSYVNQENQERNPNYYERREEENSSAQRTYTTGSYGDTQTGGNSYARNQDYATDQAGTQGYTAAQGAKGYTGNQGYSEGQTGNQGYGTEQNYTAGNPAFQEAKNASDKKEKKKQKVSGMKKQHSFGMTVIKCAALALVFGLVSSTVFYGTGLAFERTSGKQAKVETSAGNAEKPTVNNGSLSATNVSTATTVTDVSDIVENVMPSIVSITNMGQMEADFFGRRFQQETSSAGSGIIIGQTEEEIYVATNNHVVANSTQLTVNFIDDQQVTAEIKGTDASTDLAVLAVKVKDIPSDTMNQIKVATLGNSDDIKVGQSVVAIGNALGYGQSVTTGVISALDREVTVQDETTGASITNDLLQTDAAINPGNSGGALLNMNGEVIGINSVKYSDTEVEGMGYSIPISAAEPIINDLINRELVDESDSAFLGVAGQDVTGELSESFGMPEGLYITMVTENSAAAQAGIKKGDVITEFDGRKVQSMEGLQDIMQYYAANTEVEVTIQRNENGEWKEEKVSVKLGRKNN